MGEDDATIAVEAARNTVNRAEIDATCTFTTDTPDFWRKGMHATSVVRNVYPGCW